MQMHRMARQVVYLIGPITSPMPDRLLKAVTVLLLVVQTWVGIGRGQEICLPMHGGVACERPCPVNSAHRDAEHGSCESSRNGCCNSRRGDTDVTGCSEHDCESIGIADHEPCACCIHLPIPDPDQLPQQKLQAPEIPSIALAFESSWERGVALAIEREKTRTVPMDWSATAQSRALRATRLLV